MISQLYYIGNDMPECNHSDRTEFIFVNEGVCDVEIICKDCSHTLSTICLYDISDLDDIKELNNAVGDYRE